MKITLSIPKIERFMALVYFKRFIPRAFVHLLDSEKMYDQAKQINSIFHINRRYDFEG